MIFEEVIIKVDMGFKYHTRMENNNHARIKKAIINNNNNNNIFLGLNFLIVQTARLFKLNKNYKNFIKTCLSKCSLITTGDHHPSTYFLKASKLKRQGIDYLAAGF